MMNDLVSSLSAAPSGLLCVRELRDGFLAVGVLHFPDSFRPEESTAYPLLINDAHGMSAVPVALHHMSAEEREHGISFWATNRNWPVLVGAVPARFVEAFPGGNGWSTLTVSKDDPFANVLPAEQRGGGHYWVAVKDGVITGVKSPCPEKILNGMAVGGLLRDLAVWPDKNGKPHSLPIHCRDVAKNMQVATALSALQGLGKIQPEVVRELLRACPALTGVRSAGHNDPEFQKYLGALWERGGIDVERARTADQHSARSAQSSEILRAQLAEREVSGKRDASPAP